MNLYTEQKTKNHHYIVTLRDYTPVLNFYMSIKPDREKGQKWANWQKSVDTYNHFYANTPYWVQVVLWGDDDAIIQREFSNRDEAESVYCELSTCPTPPDFRAMGFE